ncbi:MAG: protein SCO1/2 [Saprospiraceae bacterium]|jgi:protein SCO1/2
MKKIELSISSALFLCLIFMFASFSTKLGAQKKDVCCFDGTSKGDSKLGLVDIPELSLLNQDGETVQLSELIKGKVVAMNFIFTTCTTVCPPMGANFTQLKKLMGDHVDKDLVMISVSIDPAIDTPQRLKKWSEKFNPGSGWTLLTGKKNEVDKLLKTLKVYTPLKEDHAPVLIMGSQGEDNWIRTDGLADPTILAKALNNYLDKSAPSKSMLLDENDLNYFTNTVLVNQRGEGMRFYEDLLANKIVVINPFFSECTGSCPVMHSRMKDIQTHFGDRIGKDVILISITVDPENDQPELLSDYAKRFDAGAGWYFLSGNEENLEIVLKKLGKNVNTREEHDTIFLIGNINTKLWKKANGLSSSNEIIKVIDSVINDIE